MWKAQINKLEADLNNTNIFRQVARLGIFSFFVLCVVQCTPEVEETYQVINPKIFNERLANIENIMSPKALINFYQPVGKDTEGATSKITHEKNARGEFEIVLLEENVLDDSIHSQKLILLAKVVDGKWKVLEIKRNWKCREGRGNPKWSNDTCR